MNSYVSVRKILTYTLLLNMIAALAKLIYGHISGSLSMVADGYHSFFDGTSNVIGLVGIWLAYNPPDKDHPYGHKKYETLASLGISILLFLTCYHILRDAYFRFMDSTTPHVTVFSFLVILATMGINIFVMKWERSKGEELKSEILISDAMHTKSDIFASVAVMISLAAVYAGIPVIDPIAAFIIAILIGWTGYQILSESAKVLSDYFRINPGLIRDVVIGVDGVTECHDIRSRGTPTDVFVDLRLHVPSDMGISEAHELAHKVEGRIKKEFAEVTEVVVHIEPEGKMAGSVGEH
ncbi:MAG: cation transporter [Nitrospirae bacterium]|nr:cation transporter [Nitrospirota bacterium]